MEPAGAIVVTALSQGSIPIPSLGANWSWGRWMYRKTFNETRGSYYLLGLQMRLLLKIRSF